SNGSMATSRAPGDRGSGRGRSRPGWTCRTRRPSRTSSSPRAIRRAVRTGSRPQHGRSPVSNRTAPGSTPAGPEASSAPNDPDPQHNEQAADGRDDRVDDPDDGRRGGGPGGDGGGGRAAH